MKKITLYMSSLLALQICSANVTAATPATVSPLQETNCSSPVIQLNSKTALLYIRNENKEPITVLFKPQVIENDPSADPANRIKDLRPAGFMSMKLPGNSFIQIIVEQKVLGSDVSLFSVTGETDSRGPLGTANNLSYGKIYIMKFTENVFGTSCFTEELKEPIKDFPQIQAVGVETRIELPKKGGTPTPVSPHDVKPGAMGG